MAVKKATVKCAVAKKELGMQKRENYQLEWITVGEQNEFAETNAKNNNFVDDVFINHSKFFGLCI